ncbi:OmpP1/FadL family transporter [Pseudoroseicyclus sp. H15]
MKTLLCGSAALALCAGAVQAGGLDRSGQSVDFIFEPGGYAELSYGMVMPDVSGQIGGVLSSGNMNPDYAQYSFSIKTDLTPNLSFGVSIDTPFGASIDYSNADPGYPVDSVGRIESVGLTALARYRFNENISVHGGARMIQADGTLTSGGVTTEFASDSGTGYVVGMAYEIPDIALRAALTYSSAIEMSHETSALGGTLPLGDTNYEWPQSVNIDFQTGIMEDTLLLAGVRWAEWTATDINVGQTGTDLIDYNHDVFTYRLGIGRRFTPNFAASATVSYEADDGELASNLSPTDGRIGLSVGGTYTMGNAEITAGVNYTKLGDATAELTGAEFTENHAFGYGISLGFRF